MKKKIFFVDHYDSFSNNVIAWLESAGRLRVERIYFDQDLTLPLGSLAPLVLSPGPNSPSECVSSYRLVEKLSGKVPILGICLGHQVLAQYAGFEIKRALFPFHGSKQKISILDHSGIFKDSDHVIELASYHSLCAKPTDKILGDWKVSARNAQSEVEAIENWACESSPLIGIQSHPESYLSSRSAGLILTRWMHIVESWYSSS